MAYVLVRGQGTCERGVQGILVWTPATQEDQKVAQERERCLKIVESEPEFPGAMPDEVRESTLKIGLENALRGTVVVTKRNIAARIRGEKP